jgi:protein involved in polysaccharide export with SLBB domain
MLAADVASTLREGNVTNLPELRPGDTVVIPTGIGVDPLAVMGGGAAVLGMVSKPGLYPVGRGQDLWTVLAAAGGLTATGDLGNVRVLTREGAGQSSVRVNLKEMLQRGARAPVLVREGDVVYVPSSTASALGRTFTGLTTLLGVTREVFQIAVLAQLYQNEGQP